MIKVFQPCMPAEEIAEAIRDVVESRWIGCGPKVRKFEEELEKRFGGNKSVVATNSCTSALHLAVRSLSLPPGSCVATTPITFISTNSVLVQECLYPRFVDVEPRTGNIDVEDLEKVVDEHGCRAIMVVHLGGYPADMDAINGIARSRGIPVIEDCAHAFGASYKGRPVGDSKNTCCWSFHAVKNLPVGDGGAVSFPRDEERARRIRNLTWLGIDRDTHSRSTNGGYDFSYQVTELGYKYQMTDLTAAVGLVMLRYVDDHNLSRRIVARRYLGGISIGEGPTYESGRQSSYHFLPWLVDNPGELIEYLRVRGIQASHHYKRNDLYPMFHAGRDLQGAEYFSEHEITLPLHPALTDRAVDYIIETVNSFSTSSFPVPANSSKLLEKT